MFSKLQQDETVISAVVADRQEQKWRHGKGPKQISDESEVDLAYLKTKNRSKLRFFSESFGEKLRFTLRLADEVTGSVTSVQLTWTANFVAFIRQHFIPMRNPTNGAAHGENNREHAGWDTDCF